MYILGINAYHADSAACLLRSGELVAAVEEERFRRVKHWAGFPVQAIRYCLEEAGVGVEDLDHVAVNRDPSAHLLKKALFSFRRRPSLDLVAARLKNASRVQRISDRLAMALEVPRAAIRARFHAIEHHRAHLASAFLVSPFEQAAVVSIDGFGDFVSTMWGQGRSHRIEVAGRVHFPHSIGLFYQAITQFLGFWRYGDEYKVMGLAAYGEPSELAAMREIVHLLPDGTFALNLECFRHHAEGIEMVWEDGEPVVGRIFSDAMADLLGPPRASDDDLSQRHRNLAASLQAMYEEAVFHLLNAVQRETGASALCLAGGCAMNSVANGKLFDRTAFRDLYVQAAAGDAGGAIGAACAVWNETLGQPRRHVMAHAFLGPWFSDERLEAELEAHAADLRGAACSIERIDDEGELCRTVAGLLADGRVVGWFQGRMEWGPRALGNRSILADPRRPDMKEILNERIKRREPFRPFAPSILREEVGGWFETDYDVPFMLQVYRIKERRRAKIPAVVHVDGTGRLQTVTRGQNPRYHRLIEAFWQRTGVPLVLNTSFNENEPIVCRPEDAIACFLRTRMDALVLGNWLICRHQDAPRETADAGQA
jgi:carbamoyltransferase